MPRGVRRYKLVLIETAYNARVNPVWGASGLDGAVAGRLERLHRSGRLLKAPGRSAAAQGRMLESVTDSNMRPGDHA